MANRIISMVLVLCTVFTFLPMQVFAEEIVSAVETSQEEQGDESLKKKITYVKNGGTFADGVEFAVDFVPGEEVTLPGDDIFLRPGHVFCGWYLESDFSGSSITKIDETMNEDVILYAKWIPLFYTVVIPDEISAEVGYFDINATVGGFFEGDRVDVSIDSKNDWKLVNGNRALPYSVSKDGNVFTNGSIVASFDNSSSERFDCAVDTASVNRAGSYTDVLTFNVSFVGIEFTVTYETGVGDTMEPDKVRAGGKFADYINFPTCPSNYVFAGWYFDPEFTKPVSSEDVILEDTVLYAQYFEVEALREETYQTSAKAYDQTPDFRILIETEKNMTVKEVEAYLSLKNAGSGDAVPLDIVGSGTSFTVGASGGFNPGSMYKLIIEGDLVKFVGYDSNVKEFHFGIFKEEVTNVTLDEDVKYLQTSEIKSLVVNDNIVTNITPQTVKVGEGENANAGGTATLGSFLCDAKSFNVGDIVAVGEAVSFGSATDLHNPITYIEIISKEGNVYFYTVANATDVLFVPDILPVANSWDKDGSKYNDSVTVSISDMTFSDDKYSKIGLSSDTEIEVGDFLALYDGVMANDGTGATVTAYARILTVETSNDNYIITYETVTYDELRSVMDVYNSQNIDDEELLPEDQREETEKRIEQNALQTGFVDDAAVQLVSATFTPEAMEEMGISSLTYTSHDGSRTVTATGSSSGSLKAKASVSKIRVSILRDLKHFSGMTGIRVVFEIDIKIVIAGKEVAFGVTLSATIEEELIVNINTNCEAEWDWWGIIPYIKEYYAEASVDFYDYTAIGLGVIIVTKEAEGDDDDDDDKVIGDKRPIAEKFEKYFKELGEGDEKKAFEYCNRLIERTKDKAESGDMSLDGTLKENVWEVATVVIDPNRLYVGNGSASVTKTLGDQYAKMLGRESDWVNLLKENVWNIHLMICWGIIDITLGVDFVIQGNVNLYIGASFWYENANRHIYTFKVFQGKFTSDKVSLVEEKYEFAFYMMGTLGLRVGFELSVKVGILTTDIASVGVSVNLGVYVKIYGFLHYKLQYTASNGKSSNWIGAFYLDFGVYAEAGLTADALKGNLEIEFDLAEVELPLVSAGKQMTAVDFAYEQKDVEKVSLKGHNNSAKLPDNLFDMYYLDLKEGLNDGEYFVVTKDWNEDFIITLTNPAFKYDIVNNVIMVEPGDEPVEEGELIITWKGEKASFAKNQFERRIPLYWDNLRDGYYIAYDTAGGSNIAPTVKKYGEQVTPPEAPVRRGYDFTGWYADSLCTTPYEFPATMPNDDALVYAGWTPATVFYTVEHYTQDIGGREYTLFGREKIAATNGSEVTGPVRNLAGFTAPEAITATVTADSGMVIKYYYTRNTYTATFNYGDPSQPDRDKVATYYYEQPIYAPIFTNPGYSFEGWTEAVPETMPAYDFSVTAFWGYADDTPYRVEYYKQNANGNGYTVVEILSLAGTTNSTAEIPEREYDGFVIKSAPYDTTISADGDAVFKVYFDRESHNVSYVDNGADKPVASESHLYGENFTPPVPTKLGYGFAGWYIDSDLTIPFDGYMTNGNLTLYAKWEAGVVGYVVNHHVQDADGQSASNKTYTTTTVYGNSKVDTVITPDVLDIGEGFYVPDVQTVKISAEGQTVIDYYYDRITYLLYVDKADGSSRDYTSYYYGESIALDDHTRTGYTFIGWDIAVPDTMPAHNLYLIASWSINKYSITFNANGGSEVEGITANYGSVITLPAEPTREGYNFTGWDITIPETMPAGDLVANATWTAIVYSITLNTVSGNIGSCPNSYSIESSVINIPNPTRAGYTFLGWTGTGLSSATKNLSIPAGSIGNRSYTATWSENSYSISYSIYGSGASGTAPSSVTLKYTQAYTIPANPFSRTGYTFAGWATSAGGGAVYSAGQSISALSETDGYSITLYPAWRANNYTISYANYASSGSVSSQSATYDTAITLRSNGFTRTGYTFIGWSLTSGGTKNFSAGQSVSNLTATAGGTVTLYPVWQANTYTVKYNANGGSGSTSSSSHTYDSAKALTGNGFSRSGYIFMGWSTNSGASDPSYSNKASVKNLTATANGTVNLYAIWLDRQYYHYNSGVESKVVDGDSNNVELYYHMSNQVNISKLKQYGCTKATITVSFTINEIKDGYQHVNIRDTNGNSLCYDGAEMKFTAGGVGVGSSSHSYTYNVSIDQLATSLRISLRATGAGEDDWEFKNLKITIDFK